MKPDERDRLVREIAAALKELRSRPATKLPDSARDGLIMSRNFLRAIINREESTQE